MWLCPVTWEIRVQLHSADKRSACIKCISRRVARSASLTCVLNCSGASQANTAQADVGVCEYWCFRLALKPRGHWSLTQSSRVISRPYHLLNVSNLSLNKCTNVSDRSSSLVILYNPFSMSSTPVRLAWDTGAGWCNCNASEPEPGLVPTQPWSG